MNCDKICCIDNLSGQCNFCNNKMETIYHFLMECTHYNKLRYVMYCKCMQILIKYHENFNLKNLLFPPLNISNQHRKQIYDQVCKYVIATKRVKYYN